MPDYQRYFVWNEGKEGTLINTFKQRQFVPPVTIGAFRIDDKTENLILDGQQRLTSILLAYLDLYPDKEVYRKYIEQYLDENDSENEEGELDNILEWNFNKLTEKGDDKEKIISNIGNNHYKKLNLEIDSNFFDTTFLGFSYLVPGISVKNIVENQQKYYSSVFRNINIEGVSLLPQESRASLYFLKAQLSPFFNPDFCKSIT